MKKILLTVCTAFLLANLNAQNIQDGINHLYADRFKNAEQTFQKILATNPNSAEATYWLGQTYLDMDNNNAARQLYDKALAANGNNPLIMVGKGHVLLLDKKKEDARQLFESAITLSTTKKGDDPVILNAIGRANVDAKEGNLDYAIQVLERAFQRDSKNPEIALNLGNAYRKRDVGVGGKAYEYYKLASDLNPRFAYPYVRIAAIYATQKQWDLVLENLNKAIQVDPSFSLGYYELFYYYFFVKQDFSQAEATLNKYIGSRSGEDHMEDDYMYSQLCWAKKDWTCSITKAEGVKAAMGANVKPKVYRQLAYSYFGKGDLAQARSNIDQFFSKAKEETPVPPDYVLKADIYTAGGATCEEVYATYMQGVAADTVVQSKIDFLTKAADFFKTKKCTKQEADMRLAIYNIRPNANPTYLVNIGILYSQANDLLKADSIFTVYTTLAPDSIYGYYWRGRINFSLDTTMTVDPYVGNMIMNYDKTLSIATTDAVRYKFHGLSAAKALMAYYINIRKSIDTAMAYVTRGLAIDTSDATLKDIKDRLEKAKKPTKPAGRTTGGKPSASIRKPVDKS
jgi:tetratricopeptide (TPR) repeat protein